MTQFCRILSQSYSVKETSLCLIKRFWTKRSKRNSIRRTRNRILLPKGDTGWIFIVCAKTTLLLQPIWSAALGFAEVTNFLNELNQKASCPFNWEEQYQNVSHWGNFSRNHNSFVEELHINNLSVRLIFQPTAKQPVLKNTCDLLSRNRRSIQILQNQQLIMLLQSRLMVFGNGKGTKILCKN